MLRPAALAVLFLAFGSLAHADERIVLTIENRSSDQTVDRLNVYPVDEDGDAVEDNLGALMEDLPPGQSTELELSLSRCDLVRAYVGLDDGSELEANIDTCTDRTLILTD